MSILATRSYQCTTGNSFNLHRLAKLFSSFSPCPSLWSVATYDRKLSVSMPKYILRKQIGPLLFLKFNWCRHILAFKDIEQGRPGGLVIYQYTRKKCSKIPKSTQNYTQVYFIPEIQRKWYTEYPYLSCSIPYTRFKKPQKPWPTLKENGVS